MLVIDEDYIAIAILRLIEVEKSVVEGAGATGLAALVQGLCPELEGANLKSVSHRHHMVSGSLALPL